MATTFYMLWPAALMALDMLHVAHAQSDMQPSADLLRALGKQPLDAGASDKLIDALWAFALDSTEDEADTQGAQSTAGQATMPKQGQQRQPAHTAHDAAYDEEYEVISDSDTGSDGFDYYEYLASVDRADKFLRSATAGTDTSGAVQQQTTHHAPATGAPTDGLPTNSSNPNATSSNSFEEGGCASFRRCRMTCMHAPRFVWFCGRMHLLCALITLTYGMLYVMHCRL